ncbi:peptide MFS transporter [Sporohalobacter salinus]|uniref:peptide MFS transporter n=1 Tax=Sporohalobacter salinus TaxID=1494606 RepID=UPI00195FDB1A|nr:peptide MFS transporter [Sporohalobacter salinus]MBM7625123.1 POT family proton-dependent oligopeptide transporter [Sporohalobacter salinus]
MAEEALEKKANYGKGFWFVSVLQMLERFSYYGMRGILILFLTQSAMGGGLGLDKATASTIYANFVMFVYFTPLAGGYIADHYLGKKQTFFIGSIFITAGMIGLFFTKTNLMLYISLLSIIIGNGLWKPNITSIVGTFYDDDDPRKDGAYSIFYTFINIGAFLAPLVCGSLASKVFAVREGGEIISYGYRYGFLAAGLSMLLGAVLYFLFADRFLGEHGEVVKKEDKEEETQEDDKELTAGEKKRSLSIVLLSFFVIIFWAGFEQAGSSLTLYAHEYIDRSVGSFVVPTSWFQSINPFLCIVLGPLFAMLFLKLSKREQGDIPTPRKMGYGLIILGLGFALMVGASLQRGNVSDPAVKASMVWLLGAYTLHTTGEMFLSPVGLSMVSKLAPKQIGAVMMGVWLFATGFGNYIAGKSAAYVEAWGALHVFSFVTAVTVGAGILLCILTPFFVKMMNEE